MDTKALRRQLLQRRGDILERLGRIARDSRHAERLNADFAEQVVELENDEVLAGLDDSIRAEVSSIDQAVARIDAGSYGICVRCRKAIPRARLEALPFATRCVACEGA